MPHFTCVLLIHFNSVHAQDDIKKQGAPDPDGTQPMCVLPDSASAFSRPHHPSNALSGMLAEATAAEELVQT